MASGIYVIRNGVNGKMYVGSALDIARRHAKHRYQLRTGKHPSKHLNAAWKKYGEDAFEFATLEECDSTVLLEREQFWMDKLHPAYNKRLIAENNLGVAHTSEHKTYMHHVIKEWATSDEGRRQLSENSKQGWSADKRAARIQALKEVWTDEKRAEVSAKQAGVDKGEKAREVRWSKPDAGVAHSEKMKANWAGRKKVTEEVLRAECETRGLQFVTLEGNRVTVHCAKHDHTASPNVYKFLRDGQGCRFCGFERSSEKQKGRHHGS